MADVSSDSSEEERIGKVPSRHSSTDESQTDHVGMDEDQPDCGGMVTDGIRQPGTSDILHYLCLKPNVNEERIEIVPRQTEVQPEENVDDYTTVIKKPRLEVYTLDTEVAATTSKDEGNTRKFVACDNCLKQTDITRPATFACIDCECYLCSYCSSFHRNHIHLDSNKEEHNQGVYKKFVDSIGYESSCTTLGESLKEVEIHLNKVIDVLLPKDENKCHITGMAVLQDGHTAVIVDSNNSCVKVVDLLNCKILRRFKCDQTPYGVAKVPRSTNDYDSLVAVTFPDVKEVSCLDLNSKENFQVHVCKVFDKCYDIEYFQQQLVTLCYSYDPGIRYYVYFVNISGLAGKFIKLTIEPGKPLSGQWTKFTLVENGTIYISSFENNRILSFDVDGQIVENFTCSRPVDICAGPDKDIFVTSFDEPDEIHTSPFSAIRGFDMDLTQKFARDLEGKNVYYLHCYNDTLYAFKHDIEEVRGDSHLLYVFFVQ